MKPASVVQHGPKATRAARDDVPTRRELLREIDRLEKRVRDQARGEAPPEPVLAFLTQYRSEAQAASTVEDRKELARKLQKFEIRFLTQR
ncbi:MAG: hypothetical protein IRZ16_06775 [Myxococcaceae bacterium]|nr:hypothetical protein [Myxococcaceae bacterium]